ncbi:hypothetical protein ACPCG0_05040 [Propionibacteriaceae bacterium Y1923]
MPRTARSRRARLVAAPLAAVAALTMIGCTQPGGSIAFEVEGHSASLNELQDAQTACAGVFGFDASSPNPALRTMVLQGLIGKALVEQNDLTFTDGQVSDVVSEDEDMAAALADPGCGPIVRDYGIFFLAATEVGAEEGIEQISAMDVRINPRVGSWDAEQLALRHTNGSLSKVGPATLDSQG